MDSLIIFSVLMCVGYFFGQHLEKQHYRSIRMRERETMSVPTMNFGAKQQMPQALESQLFVGSVVIASDYFKSFSAGLRNLVGGRVIVYESLLDRGRREAVLRMKEDAIAWGATQIVNVRFETSNIGGQSSKNKNAMVEVMAYGTAIR